MKKLLRNSSLLAVAASLFAGAAMADVEFISYNTNRNVEAPTAELVNPVDYRETTGKIGFTYDWTWVDKDYRFKKDEHYGKPWGQQAHLFEAIMRQSKKELDSLIKVDAGTTLQIASHSWGRPYYGKYISIDGPFFGKFSDIAKEVSNGEHWNWALYRVLPTIDPTSDIQYSNPTHGNVIVYGAHNNEVRDPNRAAGEIAEYRVLSESGLPDTFYWAKDLGAQTNWDFTGNQTLDNNISSVRVPEGKIMIGYDGPAQTGNALIIPPGKHNVFDMYQGYDGWNDIITSVKIVDLPEQWQYSTKGRRNDTFQLYGAVGKQVGLTEFGHYNGGHAGGYWMYQPLEGQTSGSMYIEAIPYHTYNRGQNTTVRLENGVSGVFVPEGMVVNMYTTFDHSGKPYVFGPGWWDHDALAALGLADNIKSWAFPDPKDEAKIETGNVSRVTGGLYNKSYDWTNWTPETGPVTDLTITQTRDYVQTETWTEKSRMVTYECVVEVNGDKDFPVPQCEDKIENKLRNAGETWNRIEKVASAVETDTVLDTEERVVDNPAFIDSQDTIKMEVSPTIPVRNEGGKSYDIVPANVDYVEEVTKGKHSYQMPTWSSWVDVPFDQGVDPRDQEMLKQTRSFPHATLTLPLYEVKTFECSIEVQGRPDQVAPSCDDYAVSQQMVKVDENTYERTSLVSSDSMVQDGKVTNQEREVPNPQYAPRQLVIDMTNNNGTEDYDSVEEAAEAGSWTEWAGFLSVRAVRGDAEANLTKEELEMVWIMLTNLQPDNLRGDGGFEQAASQGGNSITNTYNPLLPSAITISNPAVELGVEATYKQFQDRLKELETTINLNGIVDVEFNPE